MSAAYAPVSPKDHGADCRRGLNPASPHFGLDRERCERCRALWRRLDEAHERHCRRVGAS